jgi:hypothetical protein
MAAAQNLLDVQDDPGFRLTDTAFFLISIDTEEDNAWARPRCATTRNADFLERFQQLCERYRQRPTWLTNHEMIRSPVFRRFAGEVLARGTAEVGMHLHAWNSPPLLSLTGDDDQTQPYLIEYEPRIMREKIHALTATLEQALGVKIVSHRAGRWAFDERYAEMLLEEGYKVDCSVTPLVSWASTSGSTAGRGGTDYTRFPHEPYWIDLHDIAQPGSSDLLEVPVTIMSFRSGLIDRIVHAADRLPRALSPLSHFTRRAANRFSPPAVWLRPTDDKRQRLTDVVDRVIEDDRVHAQLVLHSSELMPGGSPTFRDSASIEALYADLESLFRRVERRFIGVTLSEFHNRFADSAIHAGHSARVTTESA